MGTIVKITPNKPDELLRIEVLDGDLEQDTAAEHAAKMAAPKPKSLLERVAELEIEIGKLKAKP